jgi:hypothetical protein
MTLIHDPGNTMQIDTLYAYMSIDAEGRHGILGDWVEGLGTMPLITGKRDLAKKMQPQAEKIAKATGRRVCLFAFDRSAYPIWESEP